MSNRRLIQDLRATALLFLPVAGAGSALATDAIPLKVALMDMSSAMGTGRGYGVMGPGMMGRGMMGYGMMGPGMMMGGMMAVRTDHPSVKAAAIHFDVTNWSQSLLHELIVIGLTTRKRPSLRLCKSEGGGRPSKSAGRKR